MTLDPRCPSCGHDNEAGVSFCSQCNFPLGDAAPAPPVPAAGAPDPAPEAKVEIDMRRIRPARRRRPADPQQQLQAQLVVVLGGMAVVIAILSVAWQGYKKNNNPAQAPVAGANAQQLADIGLATNQIKADSTNINAQIALANTLFDTANWTEAIVHYRSAMRLDSTRVTTVVDLGVCYYNLSDIATAEGLFTHALTLDPRQPIALFNLGIVAESRGELDKALGFFERASVAEPPPGVAESLKECVRRVKAGIAKKSAGGAGR